MKTFLLRLENHEMKILKLESIKNEISITEIIKSRLKELFNEYEFEKNYQEQKNRR